MIKSIRALHNQFPSLVLWNNVASNIYRLDSVNLIIGDNGSGKTRLIRAIIGDLCNEDHATNFAFEGLTDELGLIYYTAAPFHKPIKDIKTTRLSFIDASPGAEKKHQFVQTAREYVEVKNLLDLKVPTKSDISWKIEVIASKILVNFSAARSMIESWANPQFVEKYEEYRKTISEFAKLARRRNELRRRVERTRSNPYHSLFDEHEADDISEIEHSLKIAAERKFSARSALLTQFIVDCGLKTKKRAIEWLAAAQMVDFSSLKTAKRSLDFAKAFYLQQAISDPLLKDIWDRALAFTTEFIKAAGGDIGKFSWAKGELQLTVNLPELVASNLPDDLIEEAHRRGLVKIGFDTLSSGEAAITHQLASISHSIHELAQEGRRSFIIFIDEGDLLLHLSWQRQYLELVDLRLSKIREKLGLASIQVIVASHSPLLTSDFLRDSITNVQTREISTGFGAPLQKIVNYSFGTTAIGAIAEKTIDRLSVSRSRTSEDLAVIAQIDDEFVRDLLIHK